MYERENWALRKAGQNLLERRCMMGINKIEKTKN